MSLRGNLSIVSQEGILFDDTIFNNIKFFRADSIDKEVWEAIKYAELYKFVKIIKEKGKNDCGGKRN